MKKSIHTGSISFSSSSTLGRWLMAVTALLCAMSIQAQDCTIAMACNDGIQVSLEEDCMVEITAAMMLEGMVGVEADYTVTITDLNNIPLPSATVGFEHAYETLKVSVTLNGCATSCWGLITVEDKLPPTIMGCDDITVDCGEDITPGMAVPEPVFTDACGMTIVVPTFWDDVEEFPCDATLSSIVTRTWKGSDSNGNEARCTQTITLLRHLLPNTVFPEDYNDLENPSFSCDDDFLRLENGAPSPEVTGYPSGVNCSNIQYYFEDKVFDICGAGIKVLRRWTVLDWCSGQDTMGSQIIKVLDTVAPVCNTNNLPTLEVETDHHQCYGSLVVPEPDVTDCSDYTYVVGYKPVDDSGDPFTDVIFNKISVDENGIYTIEQLPLGLNWIIYFVTDACGHKTQCYRLAEVKDMQTPNAICEGFTVVTLDDFGWADVYAESIDDGSWDNCGIDTFLVKRETDNCNRPDDLLFQEKVDFCCEDAGFDYIMVTLRVIDLAGNFNDCRVQVRVQDKIAPEISCPSDVSINCTQDKDNLTLTGRATATDNCNPMVDYIDDLSDLNECGIGKINRTWYAEDQQGTRASCVQMIRIRTINELTYNNIDWPDDITIDGCNSFDADPEGKAGKPKVTTDECMNIGISYEDKKFYDVEGLCMKVVRHWKVTDWCTFDPDYPFFWEYYQKISLKNSEGPSFISGCEDKEVQGTGCSGYIDLKVEATDDCTAAHDIKYKYEIDLGNDGDIELRGNSNDASDTYAAGTHKAYFIAIDDCQNRDTCEFVFTIKDSKEPTPICFGEIVWALDRDGNAEVWASDFNHKSEDGCSRGGELRYSFTADGNTPSMTFDCSDVPNGVAARIPLKMFVIDESGNYAYCDVDLILQDSPSNRACPDAVRNRTIAGNIVNEYNEGLMDVDVMMENMSLEDYLMNKTDEAGDYAFANAELYDTYHILPTKDVDPLNGVSTLDLVMIQQHLLGMVDLDTPYKMIAADINKDNKLSAIDLIELRKLILGVQTEFKKNNSWRFVPADYLFDEESSPFDFEEDIMIKDNYLDLEDMDFIAVKTGDVNGTATANARDITTTRSLDQYGFQAIISYGEDYTAIHFTTSERDIIIGSQFTIDVGRPLEIIDIVPSGMEVTPAHFGMQNLSHGQLTFSWDSPEGYQAYSENLFSLTVNGKIRPEDIRMTSDITEAEVYTQEGRVLRADLWVAEKEESFSGFTLLQNAPNPFIDQTEISFFLPENGPVSVRLFDLGGKEVFSHSEEYTRGLNAMRIHRSDVRSAGIYYYTVSYGDLNETKKMIIMD